MSLEAPEAPAVAPTKKPWKEMTKTERAAHMRAGKDAKKTAPPAEAVASADDLAALRAELAALKAQIGEGSKRTSGTVTECWVDYLPGKMKDAVANGRPERMWSSDAPAWEALLNHPKLARRPVSLCIGKVRRDGDDFMPGTTANPNPRMEEHSTLLPEMAREKMAKWEKEKRTFDTPKADEMRAAEEALAKGNKLLAESFLVGIRELAAQMRPGVTA